MRYILFVPRGKDWEKRPEDYRFKWKMFNSRYDMFDYWQKLPVGIAVSCYYQITEAYEIELNSHRGEEFYARIIQEEQAIARCFSNGCRTLRETMKAVASLTR